MTDWNVKGQLDKHKMCYSMIIGAAAMWKKAPVIFAPCVHSTRVNQTFQQPQQ